MFLFFIFLCRQVTADERNKSRLNDTLAKSLSYLGLMARHTGKLVFPFLSKMSRLKILNNTCLFCERAYLNCLANIIIEQESSFIYGKKTKDLNYCNHFICYGNLCNYYAGYVYLLPF